MKIFLKKYWLIIAILVIAAFLRFYRLDSYPALNADEASIGYDAYSLIQTGMDQHGNPWPIHFQSFNDYKPGLYIYIVLPFVKVMGLNEWAVRLPGAGIGVLTILILYMLVKELFPNRQKFTIAEISASFLAISPWHIQFSRGGWEVNTSTFLILLGLLMFLKVLKKPSVINFIYSLLPFALSLYTYHAARVVAPLLGIALLAIYRKDLFKKENAKVLIISGILFLAFLAPLARDLVKGDVLSRAAGVGLFADPGPINRINEQRGEHGNPNSLAAKLVHNKAVNYGLAFLDNWSAHFTGEFLFMTGDSIQRNKVPETGEMYMFDILFLAAGFIYIFRNYSSNPKGYSLILFWLIVAPIAAALTFQAPNALRAENMVIPLVTIGAIGLSGILNWIQSINKKYLSFSLYFLIFALIAWSFARYEHMYWVHMAKEYPFSSQYGVKELVTYVEANQDKYKDIVLTDRYDQPYILFLFYMKYPPSEFQFRHLLTFRDQFGFSTVRDFGKYHFASIDFGTMRTEFPNSLIIGTPSEIPKEANIVKRIYGSNGYEYFDVVAN